MYSILLVDDDFFALEGMKRGVHFQELGFENVYYCTSMASACKVLEQHPVDVLVTDQGIAVNPRRPDVREKLQAAGLHVFSIEALQQKAQRLVGIPEPLRYKDKIVGVVMYRDNTILDVIRQIDEE